MRDRNEKQLRSLQADLDRALRKGQDAAAVTALVALEARDPGTPRWPHKRGDLLRRAGKRPEAVAAYARAVELYADQGFLPRAIAMAKVLLEVDPSRTDVLEQLDPSAARQLHRQQRPVAVHVDGPVTHRALDDSAVLLAGPSPAPGAGTGAAGEADDVMEIDLSDLEFEDRKPSLAAVARDATPDDAAADVAAPEIEARRLAALPLFPLFAEIPREAMLTLAHDSRLRVLGDGEPLVRVGDPADALFGIVEGQVQVRVPGADPDAAIRLGEGDVLGESCLLSDEPRRADVVADGEVVALEIPKATLNYLVRVHAGIADVLLELLTRRLLGNFVHTSRLFAGLDGATRRQVASLFKVRRARARVELLTAGEPADGLYITLTGHTEVREAGKGAPERRGAGVMFGQQSLLSGTPSELGVTTCENQLVLYLPAPSFSRVAMEHAALLSRIAELDALAHVAG